MDAKSISETTGSSLGMAEVWLPFLTSAMEEFEINTALRQVSFLANVGVESQYLTRTSENLNYRAELLLEDFRVHFPGGLVEASKYAHNPEAIANRIYGGRYGNGDEASGDGWLYRGSGLIQITFKENFEHIGKLIGVDLVKNPELLRRAGPEAARSAAAYFESHGCNELADQDDFMAICRRITGASKGTPNGYLTRSKLQQAGKKLFNLK